MSHDDLSAGASTPTEGVSGESVRQEPIEVNRTWLPVWESGSVDPRHPETPSSLFSAYYEAPHDELIVRGKVKRPGRSAAVRITGPLGGARRVSDPDVLRGEAHRLLEVADTLELVQAATATTLFKEAS